MTINILNVVLGKVDYANTNKTTFVPKNTVQTFNVTQKNDYTKITRDNHYVTDLQAKYAGIDAEEYLIAAKNNGSKTLCVTDEDFNNYGVAWDKSLAS